MLDFFIVAFTLMVLNAGVPQADAGSAVPAPKHLAVCPQKPNCVSSEARDAKQAVAPLQLKGDPAESWDGIHAIISRLPRCEIIRSNRLYLHATCKSRLFGFVDDLELLREAGTARVAIRSASRKGYSDFGVNRKRVEDLRRRLREKGLVE